MMEKELGRPRKVIGHGGRPAGKIAVMEFVEGNEPLTVAASAALIAPSAACLPLILAAPVPSMAVTVPLTVPLKPPVIVANMSFNKSPMDVDKPPSVSVFRGSNRRRFRRLEQRQGVSLVGFSKLLTL